jgi:hypothetical protein
VATDSIAGIALSPNLPAAAPTALAILDALQRRARKRRSSTTDLPRVGLVAMSLDEVGPLLSMLRKNGVDAQFLKTGAHGGGQHIEALLGSMHARLRLLPRLVWKVGIRGLARKANGVVPIGIDDALELVRSRIIDPQGVLLPGWFDDASKAHLTHGLIAIAQRAGDDS